MISRKRAIILLILLSSIALMVAVLISIRRPSGEWDAWAIWNSKARAIFEGGSLWTTEHPDYPLLLPSLVAFLWWALGSETPVVPATVSVAFAAATVFVLIRAVQKQCTETAGLVSGCILLTSPFFITQSAAQYADIPLGVFILGSFASLRAPLIAGLLAGLGCCLKNEGLLFLGSLLVSLVIKQRASLTRFLLGAAAPLLAVLYFKFFLAPPNDIFGSLSVHSVMERLASPSRYGKVFGFLSIELINVLLWGAGTLPLLAIYWLTVKGNAIPRFDSTAKIVAITLTLTFFGFVAVYLISPMDLSWHLDTSADRLILQLFPSTLFLFFLLYCRQNAGEVHPVKPIVP